MPVWTPDNAECLVYTYKEGLLSAAGHDVKLKVTRFEVTADRRGVHGSFDPSSLEVVCAMANGEDNLGALSDSDKATIEGYVQNDILDTAAHPEITWQTTQLRRDGNGNLRIQGQLGLHGRTKPIKAQVTTEGDVWVARARIRQPDFGIKPFSALLGALKIKPVVEVAFIVASPSDWEPPED